MTDTRTPAQIKMVDVINEHDNILFYGGSRSGKTLLICMYLIQRAFQNATHHLITRQKLVDARDMLVKQTMPEALRYAMGTPLRRGVHYEYNGQTMMYTFFSSGGAISVKGIGDDTVTRGRLGAGYTTIVMDEASQNTWEAKGLLETRLAAKSKQSTKMIFVLNPTIKSHWTYKLFFRGLDPDSEEPIDTSVLRYGKMQVNPKDNPHIDDKYLARLQSGGEEFRTRFLHGEYVDEMTNTIFPRFKYYEGDMPKGVFDRVVVGVDPAGSGNDSSDRTGIVAVGRIGKKIYVLEDRSDRYDDPQDWSEEAVKLARQYGERQAEVVIEENYGGKMVEVAIRHIDSDLAITRINNQKSKVARAIPISQQYSQGNVLHWGAKKGWRKLEDELQGFTQTEWLSSGLSKSPDRADALFMAINHALQFSAERPPMMIYTE